MDTKILVQTLKYKQGLRVLNIARELGVSKKMIYRWINGSRLQETKYFEVLKELIKKNDPNFESSIKETSEILAEIGNIKNEEWKDLILGLQEKLSLEQLQLLNVAGLEKDFHVSEWISGKRIPVLYKKFKLMELVKKLKFSPYDLINFGKEKRHSIKFSNQWLCVEGALKLEEISEEIFITKNGKSYLNSVCLFPKYKGKNPLKFLADENKIIVFYDEKRSTRPQPLILPKYLELNEDFLVGLGIYLGEGSRNRKPKVTNSEPLVINQAIKFFELFGIGSSKLKAWIQLHERSPKTFEEVRVFWLRNTNLEEGNLTKIRIKKSSGNSSVKPYGVIHLEASFILLQLLIENLIELTPLLMKETSKSQIVHFLRGAFAAEGSVELAKSGSLREVRYTSTREDERQMIRDLLERLGICVHEYKKGFELRVHGFKNLKTLLEIEIFKYHPIRNDKMLKGFRNLESSIRIC